MTSEYFNPQKVLLPGGRTMYFSFNFENGLVNFRRTDYKILSDGEPEYYESIRSTRHIGEDNPHFFHRNVRYSSDSGQNVIGSWYFDLQTKRIIKYVETSHGYSDTDNIYQFVVQFDPQTGSEIGKFKIHRIYDAGLLVAIDKVSQNGRGITTTIFQWEDNSMLDIAFLREQKFNPKTGEIISDVKKEFDLKTKNLKNQTKITFLPGGKHVKDVRNFED